MPYVRYVLLTWVIFCQFVIVVIGEVGFETGKPEAA